MAAARALAQDRPGPSRSATSKIGFIPITCATPIIMAEPMGFYKKHGLNVQVLKASSWAMIRDISINGETDATHMLSPMPLAISHRGGLAVGTLRHASGRERQRSGHHAAGQAQGREERRRR